jgi:hypothetical protein
MLKITCDVGSTHFDALRILPPKNPPAGLRSSFIELTKGVVFGSWEHMLSLF